MNYQETARRLEKTIAQIVQEAARAKPGSDESLLPLFSLLGELGDHSGDAELTVLKTATREAREVLGNRIDQVEVFDEDSVNTIQDFAKWLSDAYTILNKGALPEPWQSNRKPVAVEAAANTSEETGQELPFGAHRPLELSPSDILGGTVNHRVDEEHHPVGSYNGDETAGEPDEEAPDGEVEAAFEDATSKVASELVHAMVGSDEAMIPIFSIITDAIDALDGGPECWLTSLTNVRNALDRLLEEAQPLDEPTYDYLLQFTTWAQMALSARRRREEVEPFAALAAGAEEAEATPGSTPTAERDDNELAELAAKTDILLELNPEGDRELLAEFHTEATDHLEQIEASLLSIESDPRDEDHLSQLFRSFHTIKGVAGFLNLTPIQGLAHEVESALDLARQKKLVLNTALITAILKSRDALAEQVAQITECLSSGALPSEIIPVAEIILRVREAAEAAQRGEEIPPRDAPVAEASTAATAAPGSGDTQPPMDMRAASAESAQAAEGKQAPKRASISREDQSIRVNTTKLDNLMDMVGELVIVQSQIQESARQAESTGDPSFQRNMGQFGRITKELQHTSMALRMVPIKPTFQKMGRMVRDLSAKVGKQVQFITAGEDTELDRGVVENIGDPLVHMIRNAVDHGLESGEERLAAGKPENGKIQLKAYHLGSNIVIELSDDGRGIPAEKILAKARKQGIVQAGEELSEKEIVNLIFAPGFSTADQVTDISGRGVGMDVVRKNIEGLRGSVEVESREGKGSTFKVKLPLTMAIIDGLIVRVGEDKFILPTNSVKMALKAESEQLSTIQGKSEILDLRGSTLPIVRLYQRFGILDAVEDLAMGILVIVETQGRPQAILVDEMISKQEVVIKSLGSYMQGIQGVSGGAILGDGSIALILDPASLCARR